MAEKCRDRSRQTRPEARTPRAIPRSTRSDTRIRGASQQSPPGRTRRLRSSAGSLQQEDRPVSREQSGHPMGEQFGSSMSVRSRRIRGVLVERNGRHPQHVGRVATRADGMVRLVIDRILPIEVQAECVCVGPRGRWRGPRGRRIHSSGRVWRGGRSSRESVQMREPGRRVRRPGRPGACTGQRSPRGRSPSSRGGGALGNRYASIGSYARKKYMCR